jgi:hypothetical protein
MILNLGIGRCREAFNTNVQMRKFDNVQMKGS